MSLKNDFLLLLFGLSVAAAPLSVASAGAVEQPKIGECEMLYLSLVVAQSVAQPRPDIVARLTEAEKQLGCDLDRAWATVTEVTKLDPFRCVAETAIVFSAGIYYRLSGYSAYKMNFSGYCLHKPTYQAIKKVAQKVFAFVAERSKAAS